MVIGLACKLEFEFIPGPDVGLEMASTEEKISFNNMTRLLERRVSQTPMRYHAIPRFVVECEKLQPRSFPDNLPTGPQRPPSEMSRPPALGLGSIRGSKGKKKKEITQQIGSVFPPIKEQQKEEKAEVFPEQMVSSYNIGLLLSLLMLLLLFRKSGSPSLSSLQKKKKERKQTFQGRKEIRLFF